jgi:hypothetical protein
MRLGRGLNAPGSGAEANILPTGLKAGDPKCCRHKKTEDVSRTTCTLTHLVFNVIDIKARLSYTYNLKKQVLIKGGRRKDG